MTKPQTVIAFAIGACLLVTSCAGEAEEVTASPTYTVGVQPVRGLDSEPLQASAAPIDGSTLYDQEWFSLSLPPEAVSVVEEEDPTNGRSMHVWSLDGYDISLEKMPAEDGKLEGYSGATIAEDQATYYLTMLDGSASDEESVEAGPLQGWDLEGYYVMQTVPDSEHFVTYFFSNAESFVKFTYVVPFGSPLPYDIMNTLVLKEGNV